MTDDQVPMIQEAPDSKLQAAGRWHWLWGVVPGSWFLVPGLLTGCVPSPPAGHSAVESRFFSHVEVLGTRGAGAGQFNKPRSLALDREDNLYVVDMTARVQKFSPEGRYLGAWQFEQTDKGRPKGMGCDAEGNILVVEPHYTRVNHLSPRLEIVRQWGEHGTNAGQLAFPRSVAVNRHGEIYVTEYMRVERVQRFAQPGGRLLRVIGEPGQGDGQFNRPEGITVDALDRVYVADTGCRCSRVKENSCGRMAGRAAARAS
jgi:sugar lactone lactonase YvrE